MFYYNSEIVWKSVFPILHEFSEQTTATLTQPPEIFIRRRYDTTKPWEATSGLKVWMQRGLFIGNGLCPSQYNNCFEKYCANSYTNIRLLTLLLRWSLLSLTAEPEQVTELSFLQLSNYTITTTLLSQCNEHLWKKSFGQGTALQILMWTCDLGAWVKMYYQWRHTCNSNLINYTWNLTSSHQRITS